MLKLHSLSVSLWIQFLFFTNVLCSAASSQREQREIQKLSTQLKKTEKNFLGDPVDLSPPLWLIPWTSVNWTQTPKAQQNDIVDVYYLAAPLLEESFGNILADFGAYHGAVAFKNRRTNFSITINYDAHDFVHSVLWPKIIKEPNGKTELEFNVVGSNFIYLGINLTYFNTYSAMVSSIDGNLYNTFIDGWNAQINATHPYYKLFSVWNHWAGEQYLKSWDCFDFANATFNYLHEHGAKFNTKVDIRRDFANLYTSTPPQNVTDAFYNDPLVHDQIVWFYELIAADFKDLGVVDLLWEIYETYEGVFYVRLGTDYWKLSLQFPFIGVDWVPFVLPGAQK